MDANNSINMTSKTKIMSTTKTEQGDMSVYEASVQEMSRMNPNNPDQSYSIMEHKSIHISNNNNRINNKTNIDNIFFFNEEFNIPKYAPLFYIKQAQQGLNTSFATYNSNTKNIFGPFTSDEISNMYKEKQINDNTYIRTIDIFQFKEKQGQNPFEFVQIQYINNKNWVRKFTFSEYFNYFNIKSQLNVKNTFQDSNKDTKENRNKYPESKKEALTSAESKKNDFSLELSQSEIMQRINNNNYNDSTLLIVKDNKIEEIKRKNINEQLNIADEVEDEGFEEVRSKKKPYIKEKKIDQSIYMVGNKPKKQEKENKNKNNPFSKCIVDLMSNTMFCDEMKEKKEPKKLEKPIFEKFNFENIQKKKKKK
jgi:hypothetical protein